MESPARRVTPAGPLLAGFLACVVYGARVPARAQTQAPAAGQAQAEGSRPAARPGAGAKPAGEPARKKKESARTRRKRRPGPREPRREPSEAHKEEIRKTVEQRRQRRARRAQGQGPDDLRPVGAIVPWPMPPALIIRQTPQVHDEVGSLLDVLRRAR